MQEGLIQSQSKLVTEETALKCENNQHEYEVVEVYTGGTRYVCQKCGKEKHTSTLLIHEEQSNYTTIKTDEFIGKVIDGKYELLKLVGMGGLSKVFLALDNRTNKLWAVKVFDRTNKNSAVFEKIFMTEFMMMRYLEHPAIPRIVDFINTDDYLAVVMDYIEGETLEDLVKRSGPQPVEKVIDWAIQLCEVFGYLHSQTPPYILRCLKPDMVLLKPDGSIILMDLCCSEICDEPGEAGLLIPGYAAPEGVYYGKNNPRLDIYSIGVVLHRLLTGSDPTIPPYFLPPIRKIDSAFPQALENIILRCISCDPNERFQSCDELIVALKGGSVTCAKKRDIISILTSKIRFGKKKG